MARKEYIEKHKIKTIWVPLKAKHGNFDDELIREMEEIIVGTASMPTTDWKRMLKITWFIQSFFCLKSAYFVCLFLNLHLKQRIVDFAHFFIDRAKDQKPTSYPLLLDELDRVENYLNSFLNGDPKVDFAGLDIPNV